MGEFSLSGNANIGLNVVELASAKNNQNTLFYTNTTPTSTSPSAGNGSENILQSKSYNSTMQDELPDKAVNNVSGVSAGVSVSGVSVSGGTVVVTEGDDLPNNVVGSVVNASSSSVNEKINIATAAAVAALSVSNQECGPGGELSANSCGVNVNDLTNEQVSAGQQQSNKPAGTVPSLPLFHPGPGADSGAPAGTLWSTAALEDGFVPTGGHVPNVNGAGGAAGMGFQNFPSPTQQQLFGNNLNQNQVNQGRRAITASHNFPHNVGRQQSISNHPLYKGYGSWANPPSNQNWGPGNSSLWNRGRSVPNLNPLQQIGAGLAGRKPSPTFNQQQVISPVKFRRSISHPGKGPFSQPPTFEITNMDETRELLPYQVMCGTC